jgi:putative mycofactocin binding protein MftB
VTQYVLHSDCRVRKEEFGLLFYDLRGPKLLFVETGDLLDPALFEAGTASASGVSKSERLRIERLLRSLLDRGFIREQPIC